MEISYGAISSTFERVSRQLIRLEAQKRPKIKHFFKHYDARRNLKFMSGEANNLHLMWEETLFTELNEKNEKEAEIEFYSW